MTLDEAIKQQMDFAKMDEYNSKLCKDSYSKECYQKYSADHRQLAEWLTELKEARRLLKWAVEGFRKLGASLNNDGECDGDCLYCPINNHGNCLKWEYEDKVLALIVTGQYDRNGTGTWDIGISLQDEDLSYPDWDMRISFEGYTTVLEIDVPDDFELTWYNDEERMEGY